MQGGKFMTGSGVRRFAVSGGANRKPIRIWPIGRATDGVASRWLCDRSPPCKWQ